MNTEDITSLISNSTNILGVVIALLAMIFAGIQAFILWKTLEIAKRFEFQHDKKLKLDEFYKYRHDLYWKAEELKKPLQKILTNDVTLHDLKGVTKEQYNYWMYDNELVGWLNSVHDVQKIQVMHDRILTNKEKITEVVNSIKAILLFSDFPRLNESFKPIEERCSYWVDLFKRMSDGMPTAIEIAGYSKLTKYDVVEEKKYDELMNDRSVHHYSRSTLKNLPGESFDQTYTEEGTIKLIEIFQESIIEMSKK